LFTVFRYQRKIFFFGEFLFLILKVLFVSNLEDTRPPAGGVILERLLDMLSALKAGSPTASFIFGYQRTRVFFLCTKLPVAAFPFASEKTVIIMSPISPLPTMEKEIVPSFVCALETTAHSFVGAFSAFSCSLFR